MTWLRHGVLGGAVLAAVEAVALGGEPGAAWVATALLLALGLACGALIGGVEWLIARLRLRPAAAALARATTGLLALVPLGATLFEGARAQTMTGARLAPVWVPLGGVLALAAVAWLGGKLPRRVVAGLLAGFVVAVELANRGWFRSGYPQVHLFLIAASCAAACVAIALAWPPGAPSRRGRLVAAALALAVVANAGVAIAAGLAAPRQRWAIETRGMHGRQLVAFLRARLDFDGDGYAAVLGGPDCDDRDARVRPLAEDPPGDGRDQDCDGADASPPPPPRRDHAALRAAWLDEPATRARLAASRGHHVLVLSIDALRAATLADTPESRRDFPHLFALLDGSRRFTRAFSPSSGTDLSVPALMTGRSNPFDTVELTLAESLSAAGRATHALLPRELLRWVGKHLVQRGFDEVDVVVNDPGRADVGTRTTSAGVTDRALAFLDEQAAAPARRWLLWAHYFDVHEHYQIEGFDGLDAHARYRALAQVVDREAGRLLDGLAARGLDGDTIVVLCSDHGESLGEDPRLPDHHGDLVYNPLVHVPLAFRVPGVAPGVSDAVVSLIDVAPTLVELAGASPLPGANGRSLVPLIFPGAPAELTGSAPAVINETAQVSVIDWPYKLLYRPAQNLVELYDLDRDFAERDDLSAREPERARALTALYRTFPPVVIDRSPAGRRRREEAGRAPPHR